MVPDSRGIVPPGSRRRSRKHNPISTHEKIQIVHKALVCKELHGSIAKEHRVGPTTVSKLVGKAKRNKEFYSELFGMQAQAEQKHSEIKEAIATMVDQDTFLDSVGSIHKTLVSKHQLEVKPKDVHHVLKNEMQMSYKKITPLSIRANSVKNLVLRQQFAMKFLDLLQSKKVIINIDETWLGMMDFRRMKWTPKHSTNSVPQLQLSPRITMILGLDTSGKVYVCLLQQNSNS